MPLRVDWVAWLVRAAQLAQVAVAAPVLGASLVRRGEVPWAPAVCQAAVVQGEVASSCVCLTADWPGCWVTVDWPGCWATPVSRVCPTAGWLPCWATAAS